MTIIHIQGKQHFLEIISTLQQQEIYVLKFIYFYMENDELCHSMGNFIMESNTKFEDILFFYINMDYPLNKDILQMFNVSIVPYGILLKDSYVLQKFYGSNLINFLQTLDECTSTIYSGVNINNSLPENKNQEGRTLQKYNQTFNKNVLHDEEDFLDTETLISELDEKLERLVNSMPVMVFVKGTPNEPKCRYSRYLIELLRKHHIRFGFFNVLKDPFIKEALKRFTDWPTFPQVYLNGEFQGGLDIIIENLEEDPMYFQKRI